MDKINRYLLEKLEERRKTGSLRTLEWNKDLVDFCSNDYLGFARSAQLQHFVREELNKFPTLPLGSTGSRLISGNDEYTELLESRIAAFHGSESSLIYNSGYDANLGLFSSIPQRGDTIIADELIHASIVDGARLSFANKFSFKHNKLDSLEEKLKAAKGNIFVAVESIYSMDGDEAPLAGIIEIAEKYGALVIVDEAHAVGVFGAEGRGLVHHYGLQERVFARIITFGKALGCHGAAVLGSGDLRRYLINFSRSFIYTTAASPYTHACVAAAYKLLETENFPSVINEKIDDFRSAAGAFYTNFIQSTSAIQSLVLGGNFETKSLEKKLHEVGYNVRAILHPTVPAGKERLRICLHSFNTQEEIAGMVKLLKHA